MKPRTVFASLIVLFLMTACAPFPVATPRCRRPCRRR